MIIETIESLQQKNELLQKTLESQGVKSVELIAMLDIAIDCLMNIDLRIKVVEMAPDDYPSLSNRQGLVEVLRSYAKLREQEPHSAEDDKE